MSFPIDSTFSNSLCNSIASGLRPLPIQMRPSLKSVFANISELIALIPLNPGNALELRECASLLSCKLTLSDQEQGLLKDLIRQSLRIQSIVLGKGSAIPTPLNLCEALSVQRHHCPPLARLLPVLIELIRSVGLECWPLNKWILVFQDSHPYEERSPDDKVAWAKFANFYKKRPTRLNHLLGEFAKAHENAERWRVQVENLRQTAGLLPAKRLKFILQCSNYSKGNWRRHASELQCLLNGLLAEQQAETKLRDFLAELTAFATPSQARLIADSDVSQPTAMISKFTSQQQAYYCGSVTQNYFEQLKKDTLNDLNQLINGENSQNKNQLADIFRDLFNKMEKVCTDLSPKYNLAPQQRKQRALRSFNRLDQIKKNLSKSKPPLGPFVQAGLWQKFVSYLEREIDLHTLEFRAQDLLLEIVEWITALYGVWPSEPCNSEQELRTLGEYEKLPLNREMLQVTFPGLNLIETHFSDYWARALAVSDPTEAEPSQFIGDMIKALKLLEIAAPGRNELYENLHEHLQAQLPQKGKDRREALQFTKIFIFFFHFDGVLPSSLKTSDLPAQTTVEPSEKIYRPSGRKSSFSFAEKTIQRIDGKSSSQENMTMIPKTIPLSRLGTWQPPFAYHKRVARWFSAKSPLDGALFPEYCQKPIAYQELMIRLHRFIPLADFFCRRGIQLTAESYKGEKIQRLVLPAELQTFDVKQRGVIIWATTAQNVCYHRFFHVKLDSDLLVNTVQQAFENSQTDVADGDCPSEEVTNLQFTNREEDSVEVDELAGTALLRNAQFSDLSMRLQFIDL